MIGETGGFRPNPDGIQPKQEEEMLAMFLREIDFGNDDLRARIKGIISRQESFLGEGGTARVYDLGDQCIKIMPNRHVDEKADSYDLGNTVSTECQIQNSLRGLEVNGVYAPRVLSFYDGKKVNAIVMERLDAVNMQTVVSGEENFPENFFGGGTVESVDEIEKTLDAFFGALEDYVFEMHDRGVVHCDLALRNIMIDRKTGKPRLIDFGRSKRVSRASKIRKETDQKLVEVDITNLEKARGQMEKYLRSKLK